MVLLQAVFVVPCLSHFLPRRPVALFLFRWRLLLLQCAALVVGSVANAFSHFTSLPLGHWRPICGSGHFCTPDLYRAVFWVFRRSLACCATSKQLPSSWWWWWQASAYWRGWASDECVRSGADSYSLLEAAVGLQHCYTESASLQLLLKVEIWSDRVWLQNCVIRFTWVVRSQVEFRECKWAALDQPHLS